MLCHEVIEDWIESGIGYANLLRPRALGTPEVRLRTEYVARSRCGGRHARGVTRVAIR